jgi:hypothetical protein
MATAHRLHHSQNNDLQTDRESATDEEIGHADATTRALPINRTARLHWLSLQARAAADSFYNASRA